MQLKMENFLLVTLKPGEMNFVFSLTQYRKHFPFPHALSMRPTFWCQVLVTWCILYHASVSPFGPTIAIAQALKTTRLSDEGLECSHGLNSGKRH